MGKKFITNKDASRINWGETCETDTSGNAKVTFDAERFARGLAQRQAEALESIAGSSEKMAAGFDAILKKLERAETDRDSYRRRYEAQLESTQYRDRQIAALKGQITKLKKKAVQTQTT